MELLTRGIPSDEVAGFRAGTLDANGQPALVRVATGLANPCRHCLGLIEAGEDKLVLSYRPFASLQPYAETGPIFLHATACDRYESETMPGWFEFLEPAIVRGYGDDDWIRYETGAVVPGRELERACRAILNDSEIAYVHIRSKYNCFQCRVERS